MRTVTRVQIVSEARAWRGTPYQHQTSLKGVATDCLGLIRGVWRQVCGPEPETPPAYTPDWAEMRSDDPLLGAARRHLVEIAPGAVRPGDVLLFRMALGAPAKHCAILTEPLAPDQERAGTGQIVHAYWGRAVVETPLVPWWSRRIVAAFSFPGVSD